LPFGILHSHLPLWTCDSFDILHFASCICDVTPDLQGLVDLQRIETAIAEARARIAAHPERMAAADARLEEARRAVDGVRERLKANQEARREVEKNAAIYQGRLTKFKDQLSEVKTNREYQAVQHEIATAQSDLGAAEEKVIERMVEADAINADLNSAERALATAQKDVDADKRALDEEQSATERELAAATARRDALLRAIDARLVDLFRQVSRARKGVAVSLATRDGLCSVCHVRLRPPVFQRVRQNDSIVQCEVCQRILYYVPPPPPVEAPVVRT
jgi:predicted  nucleic acid-binding Zn-ribbon protein